MSKENLLHREDDINRIYKEKLPSSVLIPLFDGDYDSGIKKFFQEDPTMIYYHYAIYHSKSLIYTFVTVDNPISLEEQGSQMFFIDRNKRGFLTGMSSLVLDVHDDQDEGFKPTISWNSTRRLARRRGYGIKRLEIMNAFARIYYNAPLHSEEYMSANERKVWEKLVKQGKARNNSNNEFVFI